MPKKHDRTLAAIFSVPLPANVKWRDVEAVFVALGSQLVEGRGSRVTVFSTKQRRPFTARTHGLTPTEGRSAQCGVG